MGERSSYPPGTFCWVDLASNDVEAATAFYGELFGWSARSDDSAGRPYTTFHRDGHAVCGLYAMDAAMQERGTPPFWQSYVRVDSADQVAAQARALGAGIFVEPMDVPGAGRVAVLQDTGAAVFGIWEPHGHPGATLVNEPGSLCWNELQTHDPEGAGMFYEQLFGWALEALPGAQEPPYFNFRHDGRLAGGMLPLRPEVALLPNWAVYFAVDDCEAAAATVERLGGRLVLAPREVADLGAFAVAQDPGGALFSVIRLHHPDP